MLLLIDKPSGYTSYDLIRKLKKLYPGVKIGHAGTLDPMATGLLLIAIGKDTKQLNRFVGRNKEYIATIDLAQKTDTRDADYWEEHTTISDPPELPTRKEIEELLTSIVGTHPLPLPPFSAKKRKGKKLYEYARAGEPVFLDRPMELHDYTILSYEYPLIKLRMTVGSGTYIRSIAYRLGQQLNLGGILVALHRERIGYLALDEDR